MAAQGEATPHLALRPYVDIIDLSPGQKILKEDHCSRVSYPKKILHKTFVQNKEEPHRSMEAFQRPQDVDYTNILLCLGA